jgi:hypothetical protein
MSKKGNSELLIFLAVAVTALGGVIFFLLPSETTGQATVPFQQSIPSSQYVPNTVDSPVKSSGNSLTGNFVIPGAKEYGGGISGVSAPGTRAFPAGRAIEQGLPDQSCYTCNCMSQGISSVTREAAEKVCTNNCGGDIVSIVVGDCQ